MQNQRRSRSIGDLNKIYRYNERISRSRKRILSMIYNEQDRGTTISKNQSIRIENLRVRMSRMTLRRHNEIMRVYSNLTLNRHIPRTPKRRQRPVTAPQLRSSSRNRSGTPASPLLLRKPKPSPRPPSPRLPVKVTNIVIKDDEAIIEMQPTSHEPDHDKKDEIEEDDIIYPEDIDDYRPYIIIARYRRAVQKSTSIERKKVNFRHEPLHVGEKETETLILGLDSLAEEHGCELIFTDDDHQFDNSIYRAACGVVDLGSIHLLATDSLLTANFEFEIDLDYDKDIVRSKEKIEEFVMDFCKSISTVLSCDTNNIRIFSINRMDKETRECKVKFGLTSPEPKRTEQLAQDLQTYARSGFSSDKVLRHVIPGEYEYTWKPALKFLKLQPSDLAPEHNFDYREPGVIKEDTRGGYPYYLPIGWYRHALRVLNKYEKDPTWIGCINAKGEWAVAYHGTNANAVTGIVKHGLLISAVKRDVMLDEAIEQGGEDADHPGVYVATHCEGGAYPQYTVPFTVTVSPSTSERFNLVFQCRVKPEKFTIHEAPVTEVYYYDNELRHYSLFFSIVPQLFYLSNSIADKLLLFIDCSSFIHSIAFFEFDHDCNISVPSSNQGLFFAQSSHLTHVSVTLRLCHDCVRLLR
ncbi:unnamed protein product [Rotaria sordida]|uniref:Uncharacterized protein n=1 Tax=Rotaria sordida TaxID=392033 RepID=A0A819AB38_9BILA|nr:unnamed protein product [Rotaria sordida]